MSTTMVSSGHRWRAAISQVSMGGLMIRTPAGKGKPYGQPPAPGQCSISKAGKRIGPRPHAFSSGPIRWHGERSKFLLTTAILDAIERFIFCEQFGPKAQTT